ncbi:hypothetical protein GEMRC1_009033 [Eukaryota sp. GEM-RC1]
MEKSIYYAEKIEPLKFLSHAVYLKRLVEDSCTGVTANNPFPLTKSLIPNHIRLDTTWFKRVYASEIKGSFDDVRKDIWHSVLKPKCLPKSLSHDFKYSSISTDGVSCSLMMMRKDLLDGRGNPHKKVKAVDYIATERYIDSLSSTEIQNLNLKSKRIVAIDPNQHDLMYCASLKSEGEKKIEGFDTSANLRRRKISPKSSKKKGIECAKCHVLWNRDFNSAINIYNIVNGTIQGQGRPAVLERPKSQTTPVVDGGNTDQIPKKKTVSKGKGKAKRPLTKVRGPNKCGICFQPGHNRATCPNKPKKDVPKDSHVNQKDQES